MFRDILAQTFATPIFTRQFDDTQELNATLARTVRELMRNNPSHDHQRAHQGGFYTPGTLFEQNFPGIPEVRALMRAALRTYIDQVAATGFGRKTPIADEQLYLQGWAALTRERDYQAPHVHAGANLSAIYYVEVPGKPEPQGCIDLLNPMVIQEMTFVPGANTTHCRVVPQPGLLLAFPAYVRHTVHPFYGDGERIIIVCNGYVRPGGPARS